jgi:hypothetical protein
MSDHFTKGLSRALFCCPADYLLGHIPPIYSPIYTLIIGTYTNQHIDIEMFVPSSFTTPMMVLLQEYMPHFMKTMRAILG